MTERITIADIEAAAKARAAPSPAPRVFANLRDEIEKLMEEDGRTGTAHLVDALMSLAWPQAAVPSPAPEAVREIVRRLREPVYTEETMRRWDSWRVYIAKGGGGSWPRDAFEALLDAVDIERGEAADLLLSLRQVADYEREVAEAEIAGRKAAEASLDALRADLESTPMVKHLKTERAGWHDAALAAQDRAEKAEARLVLLGTESDYDSVLRQRDEALYNWHMVEDLLNQTLTRKETADLVGLKTAIRLLRDINEDTAVPWIHEEITAFLAAWKARYE